MEAKASKHASKREHACECARCELGGTYTIYHFNEMSSGKCVFYPLMPPLNAVHFHRTTFEFNGGSCTLQRSSAWEAGIRRVRWERPLPLTTKSSTTHYCLTP